MKLAAHSIEIAAEPAVVFDLFTTEAGLCEWMATDASLDVRPGGRWQWVHENGNTCSGEFVEVDPPHRLTFTYGWESGRFIDVVPGSTLVEVTFESTEVGTRVDLTHSGLTDERAADHTIGWAYFLGRLADTATHHSHRKGT